MGWLVIGCILPIYKIFVRCNKDSNSLKRCNQSINSTEHNLSEYCFLSYLEYKRYEFLETWPGRGLCCTSVL